MVVSHPMRASLAVLPLVLACTSVDIERLPEPPPPPVDNLVSVKGSFCTESPLAVEFPAKILFVVDVSQSMSQTDPPDPADNNYSARTRAVIDVINSLAGVPGVEIALISFQSTVNDLSQGFIPNVTAEDVARLVGYSQLLNAQNGQTNYEGALEKAFEVLVTDIDEADDLARARSKYSVIFISDGLPNPVDPPTNTPESIVELVESMQKLERERRLVELKIHTVYLSGRTPPQFQQGPIDLLRDMAEAGAGTFRNIGNGEKINFLDIDFTSFRRVFALKSFLVENANARPKNRLEEATDSDADGLSDAEERLIGTDETKLDSDADGFSDQLEHNLRHAGFDPLSGGDADCKVLPNDDYNRRDDDGDGLLNCEERFLGTNPRLYDTDADGLPDPIEARARVSPVAEDDFSDPDRDTVPNGFEIRDHTDPAVDDRMDFADLRYVYDLRRVAVNESRICYEFLVENIALVSSRAPEGEEEGWNTIRVVFGQTAADTPTDYGEFRVACARARFLASEDLKFPPSGRIEFQESDFKKPVGFDPDQDCVMP
jgi:hypothetical protein